MFLDPVLCIVSVVKTGNPYYSTVPSSFIWILSRYNFKILLEHISKIGTVIHVVLSLVQTEQHSPPPPYLKLTS